jgi:hypothetical protein
MVNPSTHFVKTGQGPAGVGSDQFVRAWSVMVGIGRSAILGSADDPMTTNARKPYHEMTPAERLADRIAKNRGIQERVAAYSKSPKPSETSSRQRPARTVLDEFQQIKRSQGIDAASEFVRGRKKQTRLSE